MLSTALCGEFYRVKIPGLSEFAIVTCQPHDQAVLEAGTPLAPAQSILREVQPQPVLEHNYRIPELDHDKRINAHFYFMPQNLLLVYKVAWKTRDDVR